MIKRYIFFFCYRVNDFFVKNIEEQCLDESIFFLGQQIGFDDKINWVRSLSYYFRLAIARVSFFLLSQKFFCLVEFFLER